MRVLVIFFALFCIRVPFSYGASIADDFDDYEVDLQVDQSRVRSLRFILGVGAIQAEHLFLQNGSQVHVYRPHTTLTAGFFFVPEFGLSALLAARSKESICFGAEGELVPITLRAFRREDFFQLGVLVGFYSTGDLKLRREAAHAGLRFGINFSKHFGWTNAGRLNFSARNDYAFSMFESGISVRF